MLKKLLHVLKIFQNNNLYAMLGTGISALLVAVSVIILGRTFTKEIFGEWMLFFSTATLMDMLRIGLFQIPLVKFLSGVESEAEKKELIGAGWVCSISVTLFFASIIYVVLFIFPQQIADSGFISFFQWYPLFSFLSLPVFVAHALLQAGQNFIKIFLVRILLWGIFLICITLNYFIFHSGLRHVIYLYLFSNFLVSTIVLLCGWTCLRTITNATKRAIAKLFHFGKYTMGTTLCSNLLRTSDVFIIGMLMTKVDVALYSMPLKMIEALDVPLLGGAMVAMPLISRASQQNDREKVEKIFYQYSGIVTLLLCPVLLGMCVFARELIYLFAGAQYIENNISIYVFRIFLLYGLFVSVDRFTGVTLDSINKPKYNFIKIIFMTSVNIIGDIIALIYFNSLIAVAMVTLANVLVGVCLGLWFLNRELNINILNIFYEGIFFIFDTSKLVFNRFVVQKS